MNLVELKMALGPMKKNAIFSAVCSCGLLLTSVAGAQEEEPVAAPESESGDAPEEAEATESEDAPSETGDEQEAEEAPETEPVEDETEATEDAAPSEDAAPPDDDAIAPPAEDEVGAPDEEPEPDYFGGLEPSSPAYQLEDPSAPDKPRYTGPFRGGAVRFGLSVGGGAYGDQTYFILGFGVGYFLVNGLELHVDTDFWLIGDPFIATPTPGLRYVMWFVPKVHPYVGGFYRHYFSGGGYPDANSIGARAGVYLMTGSNSYFGLGAAYEHMLDDDLFVDTDFIYPEVAFAFAF